jgi:hypothetical protein
MSPFGSGSPAIVQFTKNALISAHRSAVFSLDIRPVYRIDEALTDLNNPATRV